MFDVNFKELRRATSEAARQAFTFARSEHPKEQFYGFGLYSDDSAMTVCPAANTEEAFSRYLTKSPYPKSQAEQYKFESQEWRYEGIGADFFRTLEDIIKPGIDPDSDDDEDEDENEAAFQQYKAKLFATLVLALMDLDADGFFGKQAARKETLLICSVSDSPCAPWLEEESVRILNPKAVNDKYLANRRAWLSECATETYRDKPKVYREFQKIMKRGKV